jgi:hypothetical protein
MAKGLPCWNKVEHRTTSRSSALKPACSFIAPGKCRSGEKYSKPTIGAATHATAIAEFTRAVHTYANLHRTVAASLVPEEMCADPEEAQRRIGHLAELLRGERAAVRLGDIFTPAIASVFRHRLAEAVRQSALRGGVLEPQQAPRDEPRLEVNDTMPWIGEQGMPVAILATLTPLPAEIEYRIVYRDLVLLDVGANLVVDVLENALPMTPTRQEVVEPRPSATGACDIHPDLPLCWS